MAAAITSLGLTIVVLALKDSLPDRWISWSIATDVLMIAAWVRHRRGNRERGERPAAMPATRFAALLAGRQADAGLRDELRALSPDTTDDAS